MHKTVQINYCRKVLCVTAYPCVLTSVPLTYVWAFGFVGFILFCIPIYFPKQDTREKTSALRFVIAMGSYRRCDVHTMVITSKLDFGGLQVCWLCLCNQLKFSYSWVLQWTKPGSHNQLILWGGSLKIDIFHDISLLPKLWALTSLIYPGLIKTGTKPPSALRGGQATVASAAVDFCLADGQGCRHPFWKRIAEAA